MTEIYVVLHTHTFAFHYFHVHLSLTKWFCTKRKPFLQFGGNFFLHVQVQNLATITGNDIQRYSKFQPTEELVNKINLFRARKLFQIRAWVISARKAKHLDATTMFTYSHANTPLGQSERLYYLSYFIKVLVRLIDMFLLSQSSRNNKLAKLILRMVSKSLKLFLNRFSFPA